MVHQVPRDHERRRAADDVRENLQEALTPSSFAAIADALAAQLRTAVGAAPAARVHGGSIHETHRWETDDGPLFVKLAPGRQLPMLEAEAEGLEALRRANAVRVPRALAVGQAAGRAYLALEWIDFAQAPRETESRLGEQLARQHRITAGAFGWQRDNAIGSTPQPNAWSQDWVAFYRERRLRFQLDLAARRSPAGRLQERGALLLERLDALFASHDPVPSLLHGDLWGGNWAADAQGSPVIFDPAVYFGDREADLAMTRLFGGFGARFYAAYEAAWPLDAGAEARVALYNLYHVLNHFNLFGGGYGRQAEAMIERLLAAPGH